MSCLFCTADGPFSTVEHVVPQSLGNDDLLLNGEVCDACQVYFGKEIEKYVLTKTPIGFWRAYLRIPTKKGRMPAVDFSKPKNPRGRLPDVHPSHDHVRYASHADGSLSVDIEEAEMVREILRGDRTTFRNVLTPKSLNMIGRFLCKVGIEMICHQSPEHARSALFATARNYARRGTLNALWPLFFFSEGELTDITEPALFNAGGEVVQERVTLFSYSLVDYDDRYYLFRFTVGTDNWVICLNDPFPHPDIRDAYSSVEMNLIWYSPEELKNA